ncbi:MAG: hypothetical protein H7836_10840 [Magnetococcus sp. YQC-3]
MMRNRWVLGTVVLLFLGVGILLLLPNPWRLPLREQLQARGFLSYTHSEAVSMAYRRCGACHEIDKVTKYCARCGPPFIVVTHFMKKYIEISQSQGGTIPQLTDAELVTIVQVWNGLVGNWEADWRPQDLQKLVKGNKALLDLLATPAGSRPIEAALKGGHAPGSYKEQMAVEPGK